MRYVSQKKVSIIIASAISLLSTILVLVGYYLNSYNKWIFLGFVAILVFIAVYLIIFYTLNKYITRKLRPIYNTLNNIKVPNAEIFDSADDTDVISEVNKQVIKWAKRKTKEITLLKENEKYRKEFLGNVSHELKTPLFNIQGYIETLIDGGLHDNEINTNYLERTQKNINRLISIVIDLETISKLESGDLQLKFEKFNLVQIVEDVFELHEIRAKDRNISLQYIGKKNEHHFVIADKKRIFDVLSNLVLNSIIYGNDNGFTTVELHDLDNKLLVEVTDTGIGIPEKHQKRIFERFFRIDKSRSTQLGGTGLGLAIVKHIIEGHKEAINIKSQLNVGSTFSFTLRKA